MNTYTKLLRRPYYILILLFACGTAVENTNLNSLSNGFDDPPVEARPRALWDWVDGNFELEAITHELEEAKAKGMGGFDIWDVAKRVDEENIVPAGPAFMGDEYMEGIAHAIKEGDRLGLELGLVVASGWNAGGAWTKPEHTTMGVFTSTKELSGPFTGKIKIEFPKVNSQWDKGAKKVEGLEDVNKSNLPFYKEVALVATKKLSENVPLKSNEIIVFENLPQENDEVEIELPTGNWILTRYVCMPTGQPMISSTPNSKGPMIDHFSSEATEEHINYFINRLNQYVDDLANSSLKYLYTDSYEVKGQLWTPDMLEEFEKRFGYDMRPYLPVLSGHQVQSAEITQRFDYDYRQLLSDLIIESHYAKSVEVCQKHGLGFVAEAAGPGQPIHNCPFESLKSSGVLSFPRGEFWRQHGRGEEGIESLQVIKGVASASHIYNRKYVEAEAFTGTYLWQYGPKDLKTFADKAFCEGLNRVIFHTWPHTPKAAGKPGWIYSFGTLVSETRVWWPLASSFMEYLSRCQYLLQQGNFVGDILYYYGDNAPNFVSSKNTDPNNIHGYDYDYTNTDIILDSLDVENGEMVLPHGQRFKILVLPEREHMNLEVLKKLDLLIKKGATVIGPKPKRTAGLHDYEENDKALSQIADQIWGELDGKQITERIYGKGKIIWGKSVKEVLLQENILPDVIADADKGKEKHALQFIHRQSNTEDIYFLRNRSKSPFTSEVSFKQHGKNVEVWDPLTGKKYKVAAFKDNGTSTTFQLDLPLEGSCFVVFTPVDRNTLPLYKKSFTVKSIALETPWQASFDTNWGGPANATFDNLINWIDAENDSIKYYSGLATYNNTFEINADEIEKFESILLDLGRVEVIARVELNGQTVGELWSNPFVCDITPFVKAGENKLEITVANLWPNRMIGDGKLPKEQRFTKSSITRLPNAWSHPIKDLPNEQYSGLKDSGLLGPVRIHFRN